MSEETRTKDADLRFGEWQPLTPELLSDLRSMSLVEGSNFVIRRWDCKYIDARIDMRTCNIRLTPGNER